MGFEKFYFPSMGGLSVFKSVFEARFEVRRSKNELRCPKEA